MAIPCSSAAAITSSSRRLPPGWMMARAPALAAARADGMGVIAKEVLANGRLTDANRRPEDEALIARLRTAADRAGLPLDRLAIAFVAGLPGIDVVLSGAATPAQVASHVAAIGRTLDGDVRASLADVAETPERYWTTRSSLPWT